MATVAGRYPKRIPRPATLSRAARDTDETREYDEGQLSADPSNLPGPAELDALFKDGVFAPLPGYFSPPFTNMVAEPSADQLLGALTVAPQSTAARSGPGFPFASLLLFCLIAYSIANACRLVVFLDESWRHGVECALRPGAFDVFRLAWGALFIGFVALVWLPSLFLLS